MSNIKDKLLKLRNHLLFPNIVKQDIITEKMEDENHLQVKILKYDDFIKKNECREITNTIIFGPNGSPNPDGLLSNEIFGITNYERSNIYAYIDLIEWFIHPLIYIKWCRMDNNFKHLVYGTKKFSISSQGYLEEDPNGDTGIDFLKKNIKRIKIKPSESSKRDVAIEFIERHKDVMFMNKLVVVPPFCRDVMDSGDGRVSVGELNEIYSKILRMCRMLKETKEYSINIGDTNRGNIQDLILMVYDYLCGNANDGLEGSNGLAKKYGLVKRSVTSKTSDYGSRLVISAPNLKVQRLEDLKVRVGMCQTPLTSLLINFQPFVLFHVRRILEFMINQEELSIDVIMSEFTDDIIKAEIKRFIKGYSNRFSPIVLKSGKKLRFVYSTLDKDTPIERDFTWLDLFYMATYHSIQNRCVLITRFPIDSCYNQFPSMTFIGTIAKTATVKIFNTVYEDYPMITQNMVGTDTSDLFTDTLVVSNLMLDIIGGDYDGDQCSVKGVFTREANDELIKLINSKKYYIGFAGNVIRSNQKQAYLTIYALTRVLPADEMKLKQDIKMVKR